MLPLPAEAAAALAPPALRRQAASAAEALSHSCRHAYCHASLSPPYNIFTVHEKECLPSPTLPIPRHFIEITAHAHNENGRDHRGTIITFEYVTPLRSDNTSRLHAVRVGSRQRFIN